MTFWWQNSVISGKMLSQRNAPSQIPYLWKNNSPKFITIAYKYERVLKIFYFHILSIAKFG